MLTLAVVTAMTAPTAAAPIADRDVGRVQSLAGVNVITGDATGYVLVRIPRGAAIDIRRDPSRASGPNRHLVISGQGRFVGVALMKEDSHSNLPVVLAGRYAECIEPGCDKRSRRTSVIWPGEGDASADGETLPRYLKLEPGIYRIYLFADGAPVSVRLQLKGLTGRSVFRAEHEAGGFSSGAFNGPITETHTGSSFAAGDTYHGGQDGFFATFLILRAPDLGALSWGLCHYGGPAAPPSRAAYGRHCSAAPLGGGFSGTMGSGAEESFHAAFLYGYRSNSLPPNVDGSHGIGAWAEADDLRSVFTHTLILPADTS